MSSTIGSLQAFEEILRDPDSDRARLDYAAACEREGDVVRAEFVRLQVEAAIRARAGRRDQSEPWVKAYGLQRQHADVWAGPIRSEVTSFDFFRGCVEKVRIDASAFLAAADRLYRLAPIRRLSLTGAAGVLDQLFRSPHLSRIVYLSLDGEGIGDRGCEVIADSPFVAKLAWLGLRSNGITIMGTEALARSSGLPALKQVDLESNPAEIVAEDVGEDQGAIVHIRHSHEAEQIERRFGRKAWLHTVADHGRRLSYDAI